MSEKLTWPYPESRLKLMYREYKAFIRLGLLEPKPGNENLTYKQWYAILDADHRQEV